MEADLFLAPLQPFIGISITAFIHIKITTDCQNYAIWTIYIVAILFFDVSYENRSVFGLDLFHLFEILKNVFLYIK